MQHLKSTVQKTFVLLEYFTPQKPEWGVTELANAIGANKSTVYRFLADLHKVGILHKNPETEKYSLGLKLFELGNRVRIKSALVDRTHPELMEVAAGITETVHIAILDNHRIRYVDKVESPQGLKISSNIGSQNAAHATSLGKVLLAFLPPNEQERALRILFEEQRPNAFTANTIIERQLMYEELQAIRERGYAIDREEFEIGLICVGIPIFNQSDEVVASLSASGPANRFKEEEVNNYVAILRRGAEAIRQKIGHFKP